MKKILLIFVMIFSLTCLCGCSKQNNVVIDDNFIMLSLEPSPNGMVKESIIFSVNSNFLHQNSKNIQEELIFKKNLIKNVEELRNEFLFSFALTYMANPQEKYKINQGVLLSQVGYNSEGDYIGFEITFTSSGSWEYYHANENSKENNENSLKNGNIFINKQKSVGDFPFSVQIQNSQFKLGDKYKNCYLKASEGLSFDLNMKENYNPDFIYNYSTYYSKLHSNSNLNFKSDDNKFHHVWIEKDLTNCQQIELSVFIIQKGWWIFFTLLISLSFMTISIIYVKLNKKK